MAAGWRLGHRGREVDAALPALDTGDAHLGDERYLDRVVQTDRPVVPQLERYLLRVERQYRARELQHPVIPLRNDHYVEGVRGDAVAPNEDAQVGVVVDLRVDELDHDGIDAHLLVRGCPCPDYGQGRSGSRGTRELLREEVRVPPPGEVFFLPRAQGGL